MIPWRHARRPSPGELLIPGVALLCLGVPAWIAFGLPAMASPGDIASGAVLLLFLGTISGLTRHQPAQNVVAVVAVVGGTAYVAESLARWADSPLGVRGPAGAPLGASRTATILAALWVVAVVNARGVARLMLRPWRTSATFGYRLIFTASLLTTGWMLLLEGVAVDHGLWRWQGTPTLPGWEPLPAGLPCLQWLLALTTLVAITPWILNKMPRAETGDWRPLGLWVFTVVAATAGSVHSGHLPGIALGCVLLVLPSGLAASGARARPADAP